MAVNRSLTVLLPVRDAQSTLAATVAQVLEMASDLSERFELLIIDDGSSDATGEVAHELSRHYPQIRTLRHGHAVGRRSRPASPVWPKVGVTWSSFAADGVPPSSGFLGPASRCVPITWAVRGPLPARAFSP